MKLEKLVAAVLAGFFVLAATGCGDTWRGVKKDTGENLEAAGEAVEGAGKKVKE